MGVSEWVGGRERGERETLLLTKACYNVTNAGLRLGDLLRLLGASRYRQIRGLQYLYPRGLQRLYLRGLQYLYPRGHTALTRRCV